MINKKKGKLTLKNNGREYHCSVWNKSKGESRYHLAQKMLPYHFLLKVFSSFRLIFTRPLLNYLLEMQNVIGFQRADKRSKVPWTCIRSGNAWNSYGQVDFFAELILGLYRYPWYYISTNTIRHFKYRTAEGNG